MCSDKLLDAQEMGDRSVQPVQRVFFGGRTVEEMVEAGPCQQSTISSHTALLASHKFTVRPLG